MVAQYSIYFLGKGFNVSSDEKQEYILHTYICSNVYQNGSLGSQMHKIVEKRVFDKKTLLKVQNGIMHAIYLTFSRRVSFHDCILVISQLAFESSILYVRCLLQCLKSVRISHLVEMNLPTQQHQRDIPTSLKRRAEWYWIGWQSTGGIVILL